MLFYTTVEPGTLRLLKRIQSDDRFSDYTLVGGTALALSIGHRKSIDLDFFSHSQGDIDSILETIHELAEVKVLNQSRFILNLTLDEIKVDFVNYRYEFLDDPLREDGLRLAGLRDIVAMKLAAIVGRGSRKDFVDLYYLFDRIEISDALKCYLSKYHDGSEFQVMRSLTYFEDAELEPMPIMMNELSWQEVKERMIGLSLGRMN